MISREKCITMLCLYTLWHTPLLLEAQLPVKVHGDQIKKVISEIASDEYQGRATGTQGCTMAEDYIAATFNNLKLIPAGDSGTYFYHYTIVNDDYDIKPSLVIDDRSFYYGSGEDFTVAYSSDIREAEADIVFAGYGIFNPGRNRNDFDSIDIRNKIVLLKRGAPGNDIAGWRPSCIDSVKVAYCFEHGASGVLFFEPASRQNQQNLLPNYGNRLAQVTVIPGFPVFTVDERVARFILANSGQYYYRLLNIIESKTSSFHTGRKCTMIARPNSKPVFNARNVMAILPGTDRKLKDEFILIGGHLDHIGIDDNGSIRNGADDNASGPAVALGIAQAMIENGLRPKRSILFVSWTGEEMGLLGSKAWCEKPTIDLNNVVVYFNLDMVGLGNGSLNMPGTEFAPEVYRYIKEHTDTATLRRVAWSKGGMGGSDHNHFLMQGVPAFAGMTAGSHPDYHQSGDDPEKINADILQFTGDFIYQSAALIANAKESFISTERMDENKFKLLNYNVLYPIASGNYRNDLENKNYRFGFVDFSDAAASAVIEENFLTLLGAFTNASSQNNSRDNLIVAKSAYEAMMNRTGLLAAFRPDLIQWNELMFKVMAKYGYRLARIDSNSAILQDTAALRMNILLASEAGVGLILDNLVRSSMEQILSLARDPCIILSQDVSLISDSIFSRIIAKKHLLVFQPRPGHLVASEFGNFNALLKKAGKDHITVAPLDMTENCFNVFRLFMRQFIVQYPARDFQSKILTGNFQNVAAISLQP